MFSKLNLCTINCAYVQLFSHFILFLILFFFTYINCSFLMFFAPDIRKNEKLLLQNAGYVQSLNSSLITIVPTLATILTFIAHTALKLPLEPSTVSALNTITLLC